MSLGGGFLNKKRINRILNNCRIKQSNDCSLSNIIMPPVNTKKNSISKLRAEPYQMPIILKDIPKISRNSPKKTIFLSVRMPSAEPNLNSLDIYPDDK